MRRFDDEQSPGRTIGEGRLDDAVGGPLERWPPARRQIGDAAHAAGSRGVEHRLPSLHVQIERRIVRAGVDDDAGERDLAGAREHHRVLALPVVARAVVGKDDRASLVDGKRPVRAVRARIEARLAARREQSRGDRESERATHGVARNASSIRERSTLSGKRSRNELAARRASS